jgi:hypothetical protein
LGRLFFGYFLLASKRKQLAHRGDIPVSALRSSKDITATGRNPAFTLNKENHTLAHPLLRPFRAVYPKLPFQPFRFFGET